MMIVRMTVLCSVLGLSLGLTQPSKLETLRTVTRSKVPRGFSYASKRTRFLIAPYHNNDSITSRLDTRTSQFLFNDSQNEEEVSTTTVIEEKNIKKQLELKFLSIYFVATAIVAKLNLIGPYTNDLIVYDLGLSVFVGVASLIFVKSITKLANMGVLEARDSRKIIHTFSAPLFMIFWPFFSDLWGARLFAAGISLFQAVRLWIAGKGVGGKDGEELVGAVSRSGDAGEALKGPFIYVIVLSATILAFWRDDLSGIMTLSAMAAGDGVADLAGRRFGKNNKWFFAKDKSIAGSTAFFIASSLCSVGLMWWFSVTGAIVLAAPFVEVAQKLVLISAICSMVELVPVADDNYSVPLSAAILSKLLL